MRESECKNNGERTETINQKEWKGECSIHWVLMACTELYRSLNGAVHGSLSVYFTEPLLDTYCRTLLAYIPGIRPMNTPIMDPLHPPFSKCYQAQVRYHHVAFVGF